MSDWDQSLLTTRLDFIDWLEQRGFESFQEDTWSGAVLTASGKRRRIRIQLHEFWPYQAPFVLPQDDDHAGSWHRDPTGGLCLYVENDRATRPWLDAEAFLDRIRDWFNQAEAGWKDDTPDLDMERYFQPAHPRLLVLYDDLTRLLNSTVRTSRGRNNTLHVSRPMKIPAKAGRTGKRFGYCADLGELEAPVKQWSDIEPLLTQRTKVAANIRAGRIGTLILRYSRGGQEAVLALSTGFNGTDIVLAAHHSASNTAAVRRLRAGAQAATVAGKTVAVIGCGAVGSFLVDGLLRAGVKHLTLRDGDVLRPGNLIRHLASDTEVGLFKPEALRQVLSGRGPLSAEVVVVNKFLMLPEEARDLIARHDLVIDASADGAVTSLLHVAAQEAGTIVLSVCTQNSGDTVRVDLLPPPAGVPPLPPTVQRASTRPDVYEGGCGSPVSPTPAFAVIEAAALAARYACALLVGAPMSVAGETHENHPGSP